jgi:hypothetical protein
MVSLKLINNSNTTLHKPRLIINKKRNWYDIMSMTQECFDGAITDKEKALNLWGFVKNSRVHRFESEYGSEITDPIKFLGVYGYGMCYNTNYSNTFIYKIYCKDNNITDFYIGHTTNYLKRKYQHKTNSYYSNNLKIYKPTYQYKKS